MKRHAAGWTIRQPMNPTAVLESKVFQEEEKEMEPFDIDHINHGAKRFDSKLG